jgi:endonuclease YncB( thermonuclease family)
VTRPLTIIGLIASHAVVAFLTFGFTKSELTRDHGMPVFDHPTTKFDTVLDGDTVVIDGVAIHVRGLDAPELGPWAKCWAEALAARDSMQELESILISSEYKLVDRITDKDGKVSASFVKDDKFDISDNMRVDGGAAMVDGKWDWCGDSVKPTNINGRPSGAPNLWWPSGTVYDARAAD